jgi:hypothetical protein
MAKKKKDKKAKKKLKQKRQQNKLRSIRSKPQTQSQLSPEIQQLISRPSFSEMEAPDGFLPISMTQAMMEYAKPLMELSESDDIKDQNNILQIVMILWNYTIMLEDGNVSKEMKTKIIDSIKSTFGMNDKDTTELFKKMVERKNYLFPPKIQQKPSMTMFMRKEISNLITTFNYNKLDLLDDAIPPDTKDKALVKAIIKMDEFITDEADYDDWEDHYFSMEEECADRFNKWLNDKGLAEYSEDFPYWTQTYLNFIYRYMHDDLVLLKEVQPIYLEEFFADYVLRKIMVEPHEYVQFIPAIKIFYTFLHEKGYINNPEPMIELLDTFEPMFIEILRKRFG